MSNVHLLNPKQLRRKLGSISEDKLQKIEPRLIANGVKIIKIGIYKKYLESSVDAMILRLIENEENL